MKKDISKQPPMVRRSIITFRLFYTFIYFFIVGYFGSSFYYEMKEHANFAEIGMGVVAVIVISYFIWIWLWERIVNLIIKR